MWKFRLFKSEFWWETTHISRAACLPPQSMSLHPICSVKILSWRWKELKKKSTASAVKHPEFRVNPPHVQFASSLLGKICSFTAKIWLVLERKQKSDPAPDPVGSWILPKPIPSWCHVSRSGSTCLVQPPMKVLKCQGEPQLGEQNIDILVHTW